MSKTSGLIPKDLKDMDYSELIAEATGYSVMSLTKGEPLRAINQATIDLTIAWLREKGKLK